MRLRDLLSLIAEDYRANGRDWTRPGFRTLAVHRFGVWRMGIRRKLLRAPFSVLYRVLFRFCRNVYGIELPYSVRVGRQVVIEHQGGIGSSLWCESAAVIFASPYFGLLDPGTVYHDAQLQAIF